MPGIHGTASNKKASDHPQTIIRTGQDEKMWERIKKEKRK